MTDAVRAVGTTPTGVSQTVEIKEDEQYRRSKIDEALSKALLKNKAAQKTFKESKTIEYKQEIDGFSDKEAGKTAKLTLQNEKAAANVDNRILYIDEAKYNAAKLADANHEHVLIKDKKVLEMIAEDSEDFTDANGFSSNLAKRRLGMYTGFDNKLNLDEKSAGADNYGVSKGTFKKATKLAGYETEKDLTLLYKSLAALGLLGAAAATGSLMKIPFTSNVIPYDTDMNVITDPKILEKMLQGRPLTYTKDGLPIVNTKKDIARGGLGGGLRGLMSGLPGAIALAAVVKDNGGKDIFKGLSAEAIIEKGGKHIDTQIIGKRNQKIMKEILGMKNITDDDKVFALQLAYGQLTGKKVNDREMAAAYEIANFLDKHPEIRAKDYDKLPGAAPAAEAEPAEEVAKEVVKEAVPPVITKKEDPCALAVVEDGTRSQSKQNIAEAEKYTVQKNEYWYGIVSAKYGLTDSKEIMDAVHALKKLHGITDFTKNVQPKVMTLPQVIPGNLKEYGYKGAAVTLKATEPPAAAEKYTGAYTNPFKLAEIPNYGVQDCKNVMLAKGLPREAAQTQAQELAAKEPTKYIYRLAQ